jgi:hypothetical protein
MKLYAHQRQRALERYGVSLKAGDVKRIARAILRADDAVRVVEVHHAKHSAICDVLHAGTVFRVVFDIQTGIVKTFLPLRKNKARSA